MMASGGTELERPDFTPQPPKEPDEGELLIVVQGVSVDVKPDEPNLQLDELILQGVSVFLFYRCAHFCTVLLDFSCAKKLQ